MGKSPTRREIFLTRTGALADTRHVTQRPVTKLTDFR